MKLVIAGMLHETNTFSPVPTPLSAFGLHGALFDDDALAATRGSRTAMGAFIDLAEQHGARIVTPLWAHAYPSGPVDASAYDTMCGRIVDAAAQGCDGIMLALHGAMVAENSQDGEGDLLARVRAAAPGVPITVALDLHGNVTQKMIDNADIIVSFKTYPHIDIYETGEHAGRLLFDTLAGRIRPVLAWRRPPLMTHTLRSTALSGAMQRAVQAAQAAEREGMLAVSVLAGFSLADIPAPCISVVAVADGNTAEADAVAARIGRQIWDERDGFVYRSEPLAESIARAKALADAPATDGKTGPVLLLDHSDNCMSGGTCDTMDVLQEALAQGLNGIGVGPLCDPQAVAELIAAGVGQRVTVKLGNKRPMPKLGLTKTPVPLTGVVRAITDGEYVITGPTYTGERVGMGRSVVFDIGAAQIVVTESTHEPWDLGVFTSVGIDPARQRFLLLKSRMYCRPVFVPISRALVECDSAGATTSNYDLFRFEHVARPVFPLDDGVRWEA